MITIESRAHKLLEKQLKNARQECYGTGIRIDLYNWNIFEWRVTIDGYEGTPWKDGKFELEVIFDQDYNYMPPKIRFMGIPFHPNIDVETGEVSLDLIQPGTWDSKTNLLQLFIAIQFLLCNPCLDSPINTIAAEAYLNSRHLYDQIVADCAIQSHKIYHETPVETNLPKMSVEYYPQAPNDDAIKRTAVTIISYQQYYDEWCQLATTRDKLVKSERYRKAIDVETLKERLTEGALRKKMLKIKRDEAKRSYNASMGVSVTFNEIPVPEGYNPFAPPSGTDMYYPQEQQGNKSSNTEISQELMNQSRKNSIFNESRRVSEATTTYLTTTTTASKSFTTSKDMQSTISSLGTDDAGVPKSRRESLTTTDIHSRRRSDGMVKNARVSSKNLDDSSRSSVNNNTNNKSSTTTSGNTLEQPKLGQSDDEWEEEAEDLINWSSKLDDEPIKSSDIVQ